MTDTVSVPQYVRALALLERIAESEFAPREPSSVGGVPFSEIRARVGTPFFAYAGDLLEAHLERVKRALGEETELFFSLKANPSVGLCQLIASSGVGAELASIGELHVAKQAGFAPNRVIFAGPGKTNEELEAAIAWGIESINAESVGEIERLAGIAKRLGRSVRVSIRINPKDQVRGAQMRMGGGHTQFGIDEEDVPAVIERFRDDRMLDFVGVHVYTGSQIFDVQALLDNCRHVVAVAAGVAGTLGKPLDTIDFGGGFAVPYFEKSHDFDLAAFGTGFSEVVAAMRRTPGLEKARPMIELGRYLVAECGVYVASVLDVKSSRGVRYAVLDGGMNHHITATGNFGQVFRKAYPMAVLNRLEPEADESFAVVGPCCTPLDAFAQSVKLPRVETGDLVGVFYSGAYGYSASSLGFLSHPTPAEVLVRKGKLHVLREAGSGDQVLAGQRGLSEP